MAHTSSIEAYKTIPSISTCGKIVDWKWETYLSEVSFKHKEELSTLT